jgi:uncharacterized protein involved in exopolysaccharide biosynthesis
MAAERLLAGLSVKTVPRAYLITVSYTAKDPELAALITNAFVVEFLQTVTLQTLSHQRDLAQQRLTEQLATLGEKHPKVIEARALLEAAEGRLKIQPTKTAEEIEQTAGANVTFAQATTIPSSPNPLAVIVLAVLVGLVGSIVLARFRGRS